MTTFSKGELRRQLADFGFLVELHTHLRGMGDYTFWLYRVLFDDNKLPTNAQFARSKDIRWKLGPLVWDNSKNKFYRPNKADEDKIFALFEKLTRRDKLRENEIPNEWSTIQESNPDDAFRSSSNTSIYDALCEPDIGWFSKRNENLRLFLDSFVKELRHRGLTFASNFSYDIILTIDDLASALGVVRPGEDVPLDLKKKKICDRLGFNSYCRPQHYKSEMDGMSGFRYWIIWNAKLQKLQVVYGITVESLRELVGFHATVPSDAQKDARAHVKNAFSMLNPDGSTPKSIDFHSFRDAFTPEFYPRRFSLKDSIINQRLDILAYLLKNELARYSSCDPPVRYVEFSVSSADIGSKWVFDVLSSFGQIQPISYDTSASKQETSVNSLEKSPISRVESKLYQPEEKLDLNELEFCFFTSLVRRGVFPWLDLYSTETTKMRERRSEHGLVNLESLPETERVLQATRFESKFSDCEYRFLAGFRRDAVTLPVPYNQVGGGARLLYEAPAIAIHLMSKEISRSLKSVRDRATTEVDKGRTPIFLEEVEASELFRNQEDALLNLCASFNLVVEREGNPSNDNGRTALPNCSIQSCSPANDFVSSANDFFKWVVGFDLYGDELGFPYCPFVSAKFILFVLASRAFCKESRNAKLFNGNKFGLRVHCGEHAPFVDSAHPGYRMFAGHMYTVHRGLDCLKSIFNTGVRVGHGIAFATVFANLTEHTRKSNILLSELRYLAPETLKDMVFEVNQTSNYYLTNPAIGRQKPALEILLQQGLAAILSTDDEGVWPIHTCNDFGEPRGGEVYVDHTDHFSLAGEYCRLITFAHEDLWKTENSVNPMYLQRSSSMRGSEQHAAVSISVILENAVQSSFSNVPMKFLRKDHTVLAKFEKVQRDIDLQQGGAQTQSTSASSITVKSTFLSSQAVAHDALALWLLVLCKDMELDLDSRKASSVTEIPTVKFYRKLYNFIQHDQILRIENLHENFMPAGLEYRSLNIQLLIRIALFHLARPERTSFGLQEHLPLVKELEIVFKRMIEVADQKKQENWKPFETFEECKRSLFKASHLVFDCFMDMPSTKDALCAIKLSSKTDVTASNPSLEYQLVVGSTMTATSSFFNKKILAGLESLPTSLSASGRSECNLRAYTFFIKLDNREFSTESLSETKTRSRYILETPYIMFSSTNQESLPDMSSMIGDRPYLLNPRYGSVTNINSGNDPEDGRKQTRAIPNVDKLATERQFLSTGEELCTGLDQNLRSPKTQNLIFPICAHSSGASFVLRLLQTAIFHGWSFTLPESPSTNHPFLPSITDIMIPYVPWCLVTFSDGLKPFTASLESLYPQLKRFNRPSPILMSVCPPPKICGVFPKLHVSGDYSTFVDDLGHFQKMSLFELVHCKALNDAKTQSEFFNLLAKSYLRAIVQYGIFPEAFVLIERRLSLSDNVQRIHNDIVASLDSFDIKVSDQKHETIAKWSATDSFMNVVAQNIPFPLLPINTTTSTIRPYIACVEVSLIDNFGYRKPNEDNRTAEVDVPVSKQLFLFLDKLLANSFRSLAEPTWFEFLQFANASCRNLNLRLPWSTDVTVMISRISSLDAKLELFMDAYYRQVERIHELNPDLTMPTLNNVGVLAKYWSAESVRKGASGVSPNRSRTPSYSASSLIGLQIDALSTLLYIAKVLQEVFDEHRIETLLTEIECVLLNNPIILSVMENANQKSRDSRSLVSGLRFAASDIGLNRTDFASYTDISPLAETENLYGIHNRSIHAWYTRFRHSRSSMNQTQIPIINSDASPNTLQKLQSLFIRIYDGNVAEGLFAELWQLKRSNKLEDHEMFLRCLEFAMRSHEHLKYGFQHATHKIVDLVHVDDTAIKKDLLKRSLGFVREHFFFAHVNGLVLVRDLDGLDKVWKPDDSYLAQNLQYKTEIHETVSHYVSSSKLDVSQISISAAEDRFIAFIELGKEDGGREHFAELSRAYDLTAHYDDSIRNARYRKLAQTCSLHWKQYETDEKNQLDRQSGLKFFLHFKRVLNSVAATCDVRLVNAFLKMLEEEWLSNQAISNFYTLMLFHNNGAYALVEASHDSHSEVRSQQYNLAVERLENGILQAETLTNIQERLTAIADMHDSLAEIHILHSKTEAAKEHLRKALNLVRTEEENVKTGFTTLFQGTRTNFNDFVNVTLVGRQSAIRRLENEALNRGSY